MRDGLARCAAIEDVQIGGGWAVCAFVDDVRVNGVLDRARSALVTSIEDLVASLDGEGRGAAAARTGEDALQVVHDLLEHRYGIGLLSDWTLELPDYEAPVTTVRLSLDVVDEQSRDIIAPSVDECLCQGLDEDRFALLSTRRLFPGARGSAGDPLSEEPVRKPSITEGDATRSNIQELSPKRQALSDRVVSDLDRYLEALDEAGDLPGKKAVRRVYKRQGRFETSLYRLHRKVLRKTQAPLITTWAYMWDELPSSGPVVVLAVFDLADDETQENLLPAILSALDGLAPGAFVLAAATPVPD